MLHNAFICCITSFVFSMTAMPQENETDKFKSRHSVGIAIGHAHVFEGRDAEGNKAVLGLPMWAFDFRRNG
ncbi:MAG: hypothetical protein MUE71_09255 [Chitinophagaceae bacterium]|nr:hypothetical protein [Chitinophagaceae bacterium]MCU0403881.1 hypothetical protein [Chitinophagaceae bacterium]